MRSRFVFAAAFAALLGETAGFLVVGRPTTTTPRPLSMSTSDSVDVDVDVEINEKGQLRSAAAAKFKILTCTSTACAKKRSALMMDEYATFGAFYGPIKESSNCEVALEESPCLGSCKRAPCVAIEHEDYEGTVALEGMTGDEFSASWLVSAIDEQLYSVLSWVYSKWKSTAPLTSTALSSFSFLLTLQFS